MSSFLSILLLIFALVIISCEQQRGRMVKIVLDETDSLYMDSMAKAYSDSFSVVMDSILKDRTSRKSFVDTGLWDAGEFVSTAYQIHTPQLDNGTNDLEQIFTVKEEETLNALIAKFENQTANEIAIVIIRRQRGKESLMHKEVRMLMILKMCI